MKIIQDSITEDDFAAILQEKDNVIIDVFTEWCQPCQELKGVLEEIENENKSIAITSINLESNDWIAEKFAISSIPHLLFFKNGKKKLDFVGGAPKSLIEKYLANAFEDKPFFSTIKAKNRIELEKGISKNGKTLILPIDNSDQEKIGMFNQLTPYLLEIFADRPEIQLKILDITNNSAIQKEYENVDSLIGLFYENGELKGTQGIYSPDLIIIGIMELFEGKKTIQKKQSISEADFESLKAKGSCVIEISKQKGYVSQLVKPFYYRMAKDTPQIPFYSIEFDLNKSWIQSKLEIKDEEYQDFGEEGKKVPYYIFVKDGKVLKETGPIPPEEMVMLVNGDLLGLYKVEYYTQGVSEEEFRNIIKKNSFVIVDVYADWCGPCKMMKPIFSNLSGKYENIKFVSVNNDCAQWLGAPDHYDFDGIPAFLFFVKGELAYKQIGGLEEEDFIALIDKHMQ